MSDGKTTKKKLNKGICQMILNWLQSFESIKQKIKAIDELANGHFFVELIKIQMKHTNNFESWDEFDLSDIGIRYQLIKYAFESQFKIEEGVDFDLARNLNEYELAKIVFIILINGITMEIKEFEDASEKMDPQLFKMMNTFYFICEREKARLPPTTMKIYDEFLNSTSNSRRSISKEFCNGGPSSSASKSNTILNSANLLLSPMQKASIHAYSPMNKNLKNLEEEFQREKRKLEKEINIKDITIYDLQDQIHEKQEKIKQYEMKIEEFNRKIVELNSLKQKIYDYDAMQERLSQCEKELNYFEEKWRKSADELEELKLLREEHQTIVQRMHVLSSDFEKLEKKEKGSVLELKRLCRIENDAAELKSKLEFKEMEILSLIGEKGELECELSKARSDFSQLQEKLNLQVEELSNQNAHLNSQINLKNAQQKTLEEMRIQDVDELKEKLEDKHSKLANLEEKYTELEIKNQELLGIKEKLQGENTIYKSKIQNLQIEKEHLEARYNSSMSEWKSLNSQANNSLKAKEILLDQTIEEMKNLRAVYEKLKESSEGEINELNRLIENLKQEKRTVDQKCSELAIELSAKNEQILEAECQVHKLKSENFEMKKELEAEVIQKLFRINELEEKIAEAGKKYESLKRSGDEAVKKLSSEFSGEKSLLENKLNELRVELESKSADFKNMEKLLNDFKKDREEEVKQYASENDSLSIQLNSAKEALEMERLKFAEDNAQIKLAVESLNAQLVKSQKLVSAEMSSRAEDNKKYEAEFESLRQQLSAKIEENLKLQSQLAEESKSYNEKLAEYHNEYSAKNQELRLLQKRVQEMQQSHLNESNQLKSKVEQLSGQLETKTGSFESERHSLEAENERLLEKIKTAQNERDSLLASCTNKEAEVTRLTQDLDARVRLSAKIESEYKLELEKSKSDLSNMESLLSQMTMNHEEEVRILNASLFDVKTQVDKAKQDFSSLDALFASVKLKHESELKSMQEKINEGEKMKKESSAVFETTKSTYEQKLTEMDKKIFELRNELSARMNDTSRLDVLKSECDKEMAALQAKLSSVEVKLREAECHLEATNSYVQQLNAEKQMVNKKVMELEGELNKKLFELQQVSVEFERLRLLSEDKTKKLDTFEVTLKNCESESNNAKQNQLALKTSLEMKSKECNTLKVSLSEFEAALTQKTNEINALKIRNQKLTEHMNTVELSLTNINNQLKFEREQSESIQKRLRDEILHKQADLDCAKAKLNEAEVRLVKKELEAQERIGSVELALKEEQITNENFKTIVNKLNAEISEKVRFIKEQEDTMKQLEKQMSDIRDYGNKLQEHYQHKKKVFMEAESQNTELRNNLALIEAEVKAVRDENNLLREKYKTVTFENQQLKAQKDEMYKKLSEMTVVVDQRDAGMTTISKRPTSYKETALSTPKRSFDDSFVKYTSPDLRTNDATMKNAVNQDDLSRRFSIDSYSRVGSGSIASVAPTPSIGNASSSVGSMAVPSFNRFNAISENEYEEPSLNQKYLQIQDSSINLNRLSTLQTRNLKQKPHLKSSYAIEMLPVNENYIRGDQPNTTATADNKENRMSAISQKTFNKRPHDGSIEPKTPKKSNR